MTHTGAKLLQPTRIVRCRGGSETMNKHEITQSIVRLFDMTRRLSLYKKLPKLLDAVWYALHWSPENEFYRKSKR